MAIDATPSRRETPDGLAQAGLVERHEHLAVEAHPLGDLPDPRAGDQRGGLLDEEVVELVALLPADDQDVAEAPGRQERDVPALPLDDDVRAERGPVHGLHEVGPAEPRAGDQLAEPLHARPGRVVRRREPLAGEEAPVVGLEREVGEGPADVEADPEGHGLSVTGTSAACPARAGRRGRGVSGARSRVGRADRRGIGSCGPALHWGPVSEQSERPPSRWPWLPDVGAILVVALLVVVKCWNLLRPWEREYRTGDFALSIEPHFYHWLKRGVVLLWDPTIGTGSWLLGGGTHPRFPVISNLHLFYPLNLLWLGLAERHYAIAYSALLGHHLFHYGLAGAFTYAYARILGVDRLPATVSSIAFVFSGFMMAHFNHWTFVDAVAWLPAILACVVRADQTGRLWWGALGGAALGVALLAGAPQFAMYNAFAVSGLALVLVGRRVGAGHPWGRLSLACLLVPVVALGVAAVQLFPAWAVATGSYRAGLGFGWKAVGSLPLSAVFQLGLPGAIQPLTTWLNDETYFYPGILPVLLAGYALTFRWDWRVGFHAALGLGALLLAFGDRFVLYRVAFDLIPGVALFRIPARILVLFNFATAILAGLGVHALLRSRQPTGFRRVLTWLMALAASVAPGMYLLLLWSANGVVAEAAATLADQYVLLLLVLILIFAAVAWQARGDAPGLVRAAILAALVLDLILGSLPINGTRSHPDRESGKERELATFLDAQPGPFRASLAERLGPRTIYRHGISVVDGGSTFAPSRFLDLYFLVDENPRILDLLNVRYLAKSSRQPVPEPVQGLVLPPGAFHRVTLPAPRLTQTLELDSRLIVGRDVPDGTPVAVIHAIDTGGASHTLQVRAGHETAEWTMDRPVEAWPTGSLPSRARGRCPPRGLKGTATAPPSGSLRAFVWPSWPSSGRRPAGGSRSRRSGSTERLSVGERPTA